MDSPQDLSGFLVFPFHASISYISSHHPVLQGPVAILLVQALGQSPAGPCGTGQTSLWSGIDFKAAQLSCLACPGTNRPASQEMPAPTSFPVGVSCDVWLLGLSCGHWRPLSRRSQLSSPSFPSFPPPASVQLRFRNQPLTALPLPRPCSFL